MTVEKDAVTKVENVAAGAVLTGASIAEVDVTATAEDYDVTIDKTKYTFTGDSDKAATITGGEITGLDAGASLQVGTDGIYTVNGETLTLKASDTVIGTDGSAYIFDPSVVNVDPESAEDVSEIVDQLGIEQNESLEGADLLSAEDLSAQDGNIAVTLSSDNTDGDIDFSNTSGTKQITDNSGSDLSLAFNDEGGNVAAVEGDGEKSVALGDGGDALIAKDTPNLNATLGAGSDTVAMSGTNANLNMSKGGSPEITATNSTLELTGSAENAKFKNPNLTNIEKSFDNGDIVFGKSTMSLFGSEIKFDASTLDEDGNPITNLTTLRVPVRTAQILI